MKTYIQPITEIHSAGPYILNDLSTHEKVGSLGQLGNTGIFDDGMDDYFVNSGIHVWDEEEDDQ